MLRHGDRIRLTDKEIRKLEKLTDFVPVGIHTLADLDEYFARSRQYYAGTSKAARKLHRKINKQQQRLAA